MSAADTTAGAPAKYLFYFAVFFNLMDFAAYLVNLGGLSLNYLLLAGALGLTLLYLLNGAFTLRLSEEHAYLVIFMLLVSLSISKSVREEATLLIYKKTISDAMMFVLVGLLIRSRKDVVALSTSLAWVALCISIYVAYLKSVGNPDAETAYRTEIKGWDPNELALMVTACVPACFVVLRLSPSRFARTIALLAVPMVGSVVLFSASRTAFLMYTFTLGVLFMLKQIPVRWVALGLTGLMLSMPYFPEENLSRLMILPGMDHASSSMSNREYAGNVESTELRVRVWKHCVTDMMPQAPVFGLGLGNFVAYSYAGVNAHSVYFSLLGELGWTGLGTFFILMLSALLRYVRLALYHWRTDQPELLLITLNYGLALFVILTGSNSLDLQFRVKYLWILFGLPLALTRITYRASQPAVAA